MRLSHVTVLLACSLAATSPSRAQSLDYTGLSRRFLERVGRAGADPATLDLEALLDQSFAHVRIGLFDLYTPAGTPDQLSDYQRVALAVLGAQDRWIDWLAPAADVMRDVQADQRTLRKWISSWSSGRAAELAATGGDLLGVLGADEDVRAAAARFSDYMIAGSALGLAREGGEVESVVLVPDRERFTEFLCFGGWLYPHLQPVFWQPGVVDWTNFYIDDFKVIAMQFAAPGRSPGDYATGMRMDARTPTGLEQQMVQLACDSMLANYFGDRLPPSLAGALAVNLVIDLYGECNTRVDGDLRARRTEAREVFVPGGNSEGGILPPHLADSRWRSEHGADHFQGALRLALEKRRGKAPYTFQLTDDAERERMSVAAPFLGSAASGEAVPSEFYGDRLEFLRSYRSCFLHWLREKGAGSKKACALAFARLLQELAKNPDPERIEAVFADVYGDPLSAVELGDDHLEGRFLKYLEKLR